MSSEFNPSEPEDAVEPNASGIAPQTEGVVAVAKKIAPPAVVAFSEAARQGFMEYLGTLESKKTTMDVTKRARYRNYHANPKVKINESDPVEKQRIFNERYDALNHFEINPLDNQLLRQPQKSGEKHRIVAFDYDAFEYIEKAHYKGGHNGIKKTYQSLIKDVYGITRRDVEWVLAHCKVCQLNKINSSRAPLQPIVATKVHERVQGDLIDMRHQPDGQWKWIFHLKDHFSKHSMLYAMKSKRATEVADNLNLYIRHIGAPEIFQFDNGREFKGACLILARRCFIKVRNGRPRTPRTQGLVEQANKVVKDKITRWQAENGTSAWNECLTHVCNAINYQTHESLPRGVTPARLMFLRIPNPVKYVNLYTQSAIWRSLTEDVIDRLVAAGDRPDDTGNMATETSLATFFNQQMSAIPTEDSPILDDSFNPDITETMATVVQQKDDYTLLAEDLIGNQSEGGLRSRSATVNSNEYLSAVSLLHENQHVESENGNSRTNTDKENDMKLLEVANALLEQQQHELENNTKLHQEGVRSRMQKKYAKGHNVIEFVAGEIATIRVPSHDRAATDNKRIPCEILDVRHDNRHQILTKYGVLDRWFPTSELNKVPELDWPDIRKTDLVEAPRTVVTLHSVAALLGHSQRIHLSCNCKGKCGPRCRCKKNGKPCTQYCHDAEDLECGNNGTVLEGTEQAVVGRGTKRTATAKNKGKKAIRNSAKSVNFTEASGSGGPPNSGDNTGGLANSRGYPAEILAVRTVAPVTRSQSKRPRANTTTNRKRSKKGKEAAENEYVPPPAGQMSLSQFENTAPLVGKLKGFHGKR